MGTPVATIDGLTRMATLLLADADFSAVGTGTDAPVVGDTQLLAESNRSSVALRLSQGNNIQVRTLHGNSDLPTTVEELGLYLDASSSPNNGDMLTRVLETFEKSTNDLLVVWSITIAEG